MTWSGCSGRDGRRLCACGAGKGAVGAVNADERVKVQLVGQVDVIEELQKYAYPKERVEISSQ